MKCRQCKFCKSVEKDNYYGFSSGNICTNSNSSFYEKKVFDKFEDIKGPEKCALFQEKQELDF